MTRKMMLLRDGSERPFPGDVMLSSSHTSWPGFPIESRKWIGQGAVEDFELPTGCLGLCVRGRSLLTLEDRADRQEYEFTPGKLCTGRSRRQIKAFRWNGEYEAIVLQLTTPRLPLLGTGTKGNTLGDSVTSRGGFRDPQLQRLVMLMFADVKAGCPAGALYGESLSLALIEYLGERYCDLDKRPGAEKMALSSAQLKRVHDYITANLGGNLTVVEMAALLDLSPSHFTVLFRNATGRTPHQYVLFERIAASRRLMESGHRSLAEIALALGFSSQSHFATSFRRAIGMTPRAYQQRRGSRTPRLEEMPGQGA
jgi:AraC family transcriptional regulator